MLHKFHQAQSKFYSKPNPSKRIGNQEKSSTKSLLAQSFQLVHESIDRRSTRTTAGTSTSGGRGFSFLGRRLAIVILLVLFVISGFLAIVIAIFLGLLDYLTISLFTLLIFLPLFLLLLRLLLTILLDQSTQFGIMEW